MARGILITELLRAQDFRVEVRTSDPSSPADGRCWVRSDLDSEPDKLGEFRFADAGQVRYAWLMTPSTTPTGVEEQLRIETGTGVGVLPLTPRADSPVPALSFEAPGGVRGAWSPPEVTVETDPATGVTESAAQLNGDLLEMIYADSVDVFFEWRQSGSSSWNTTPVQDLQSAQTFSDSLNGLADSTQYEFRARAVPAEHGQYDDTGVIASFTTEAGVPVGGVSRFNFEQTLNDSWSSNHMTVESGDSKYSNGSEQGNYSLNSVGDVFDIPFNFNDNQEFTVAFHFRLHSTSSEIIYLIDSTDGSSGMLFDNRTSDWRFGFYEGGSFSTIGFGTVSTYTWYHVAMTWDGDTYRLFRNSSLEDTLGAISYTSGGSGFELCGDVESDGESSYFDGQIDDLQFYTRALSQSEIVNVMQNGKP